MENSKKTLYIGAHPDDIFIGAGINLSRNLKNSHILTITDGEFTVYPKRTGNMTFQTPEEYSRKRIAEDRHAMQTLGIDINTRYTTGEIPDTQTYRNIRKITIIIEKLVKKKGIKRIFTHSFPEAHPDHEIVWFCSHIVGQRQGIDVWEYITYRLNGNNEYVWTFLNESDIEEIIEQSFTAEEQELKNRVALLYPSQRHVMNLFKRTNETIGKRKTFSLDNLPSTAYHYRDQEGLPTPQDIRNAMKEHSEIFNRI